MREDANRVYVEGLKEVEVISGDSARSVRAATHLKRASVEWSSSVTLTSVGRISPRRTTWRTHIVKR